MTLSKSYHIIKTTSVLPVAFEVQDEEDLFLNGESISSCFTCSREPTLQEDKNKVVYSSFNESFTKVISKFLGAEYPGRLDFLLYKRDSI